MFLVYLAVLLRPRLKTMYHWCQNRYRDWEQAREERENERLAARNANINMLQTDDDYDDSELPHGEDDRRPLLHSPNRDF